MVDTQVRPALTLTEALQRATEAVAAAEQRLAEAKSDLTQFERNMGRMVDEPVDIAATLAAKRALIDVAAAALEAAQAAAEAPILDPRVQIIQREEEQRAELFRLTFPIDQELKSLAARLNELRPKSQSYWRTMTVLTHSIERRQSAIGADIDPHWDRKLAAQIEAEASHD